MPSIEDNKDVWAKTHDWQQLGNEWSDRWGSPDMQWYGTILPRIHRYLPAATMLEIAPGYGRWTNYLKDLCSHLVVVDLSEPCIEYCKERFRSCSHIEYFVNDGLSLAQVPDDSVDFAFSFDSLVHVEDDVMESYVSQLSRKLKKSGVAFLHHSNLGNYPLSSRLLKALPRNRITHWFFSPTVLISHWRGPSMTAEKLARIAKNSGLKCLSQELINWQSLRLMDCISVVAHNDSPWPEAVRALKNPGFMQEAKMFKRLAVLYGISPQTGLPKG